MLNRCSANRIKAIIDKRKTREKHKKTESLRLNTSNQEEKFLLRAEKVLRELVPFVSGFQSPGRCCALWKFLLVEKI